ncbi:MAG: hypothetical protein C4527_05930 [Candidatus Omnitrophota bacterium]|jgi:hypothetical protein|nr:MAG: hypothetical protein C4527_05930 [Candidatus Omnitrophota bacterium]
MNKRAHLFFCIVIIQVFFYSTAVAEEARIMAGIAQTDITPPIGGRTWGYAAAKPTDGLYDRLMARVLILQSSDTTAALVSWDVCEFQSPWLRDHMPEMGIDTLLLFNSHTHAGPDLSQSDFPSADKPWKRTIEERILEAIKEAQKNLFPAYIAAEKGSIPLGYNRLRRDPDGLATTIFNNLDRIPYGPVDPTVGILRVTDETGKIRVVLVNYACHAVVLGSENRKISADYPGAMARAVEQRLNEVMCMFVQGGGDINPLFMGRSGDPKEDYEPVLKMGNRLADNVMDTLDRMKDIPGKSQQFVTATEVLTVNHRWEREKTLRFGVTSILINHEIGIVTLPGEPFIKFQFDVRERAALPFAFLFGYCDNSYQDWPNWYLPDIEAAAREGYGASDAGIAEVGTGERLMNQGLIQLYTLRGMLHAEPKPGRRG